MIRSVKGNRRIWAKGPEDATHRASLPSPLVPLLFRPSKTETPRYANVKNAITKYDNNQVALNPS
jgi:hypothetical protein